MARRVAAAFVRGTLVNKHQLLSVVVLGLSITLGLHGLKAKCTSAL